MLSLGGSHIQVQLHQRHMQIQTGIDKTPRQTGQGRAGMTTEVLRGEDRMRDDDEDSDAV